MIFNIDIFVKSYPILQIFFSFILVSGLWFIGEKTLNILNLNNSLIKISDLNYQKVLIGLNSFIFIAYPLIFLFQNVYYIYFLSLLLFILGIINIIKSIPKFDTDLKKIIILDKNIDQNLITLILISYLILSLSVATHADIFGYHFVLANNLIEKGFFDVNLLNLHSFFFGAGEFYTAIGLFWGAENFVSLVQFFGLYSFYGIIKKNIKKKLYYILLILFSSPVIIFLASSHKSQLFNIFSSTLIFYIFFIKDRNFINKKNYTNLSFLALIILTSSYHSKFSFILSSILIFLKVLYENYKLNNFYKVFTFSCIVFIISIFPVFFWKIQTLNFQFFELFYSPFPNSILDFQNFKNYLFNYKRDTLSLINIFIPFKLAEITKSLSIGGLLIFFIIFNSNKKINFSKFLIIIFLTLTYFFGQFTARSIFEAFIWTILIFATYDVNINLNQFRHFIRAQAIVVLLLINYGNYILIPSTLSENNKIRVLKKYADGYSLITWAKNVLSEDEKIISLHRSVYFGGSNFISGEFADFINKNSHQNDKLINKIKELNPKYILTYGKNNLLFSTLEKCFGNLVKFKKNVGFKATRNPLNRSSDYDGLIYEFKIEDFPKCWKD